MHHSLSRLKSNSRGAISWCTTGHQGGIQLGHSSTLESCTPPPPPPPPPQPSLNGVFVYPAIFFSNFVVSNGICKRVQHGMSLERWVQGPKQGVVGETRFRKISVQPPGKTSTRASMMLIFQTCIQINSMNVLPGIKRRGGANFGCNARNGQKKQKLSKSKKLKRG